MKNQIQKVREKLDIYWKKIINKNLLEKILQKFAPSYSITDISRKKLISPLKRGKYYINNISRELENPFIIADKYFEWEKYMFWWLWVYNMYWFSTQLIEWYTIYNTKISGDRTIWKTKFIFVKERDSFFYWNIINKNWTDRYQIMSKERAFIQMIKEKRIIKSVPADIDKQKLLIMAKRYSSKTIFSKIEKLCL
jgi:hypothetical protein